jgi:hypothetical protein
MMIETEANNIIFTCDSCGYAQLFEKKHYSFYQALDKIKDNGWEIVGIDHKSGSEFKHYCPYCESDM